MPVEIERKFLVCSAEWRALVERRERHRQGYLVKTPKMSIRVRCSGSRASITVKGPREGIVRREFEYAVPVRHAEEMLARFCGAPTVEKVRHWLRYDGMIWQVDEYCGAAAGLVLAEIELDRADQLFSLPEWVGLEVTHDLRYRNSAIASGAWRAPPRSGRGSGKVRGAHGPGGRAEASSAAHSSPP